MLRVGIVAGEASGDYLAAELIKALRRKNPGIDVEGIGGERLQEAGCRILYPLSRLSVMGITEVAGKYLDLVKLRRELIVHFLANPPDIFIGVDAPDFNLEIEERLRHNGIKTVHYVSPSVWAWRRYRIKKIARAVDLMLTLFPFEKAFYDQHGVPAEYVGHPLADRIDMEHDKSAARKRLGLVDDKKIVAILPGSRKSELEKLVQPMLLTADWCMHNGKDLCFISSVLDDDSVNYIEQTRHKLGLQDLPLTVFRDRTDDILAAADVVFAASGTITLEAMLYKRPMVVTYKMNWLSYFLIRALVKINYVALPNILAGEGVVPEFLQKDCRPQRMGPALLHWLQDPAAAAELVSRFHALHRELKQNAADKAANAIVSRLVSG